MSEQRNDKCDWPTAPSATPRTDAKEMVDSLHWEQEHNFNGPMVVPAEFARQLERELAVERKLRQAQVSSMLATERNLEAELKAARSSTEGVASEDVLDIMKFEKAPCYRCGYNSHSYYQPSVHKCAAEYHLIKKLMGRFSDPLVAAEEYLKLEKTLPSSIAFTEDEENFIRNALAEYCEVPCGSPEAPLCRCDSLVERMKRFAPSAKGGTSE